MIGIIGAMSVEVEKLINSLEKAGEDTVSGIRYVAGRLGGRAVVVAKCGVGKVNAAVSAQTMILKYHPELILNTGVAGALSPALDIGDVVVARHTVQHDMDTSPLGDPVGFVSGLDMIELPCAPAAVEKLLAAAASVPGLRARAGVAASGDQFLSDREKKDAVAGRFGADVCEMEGAAIGQVCVLNGVDYAVIRAVSDRADDTAAVDFNAFAAMAAENSVRLIEAFLRM